MTLDLEESVEDHLNTEVARFGGIAVKLNPAGYKGIPDRLVLLPGGRIAFVELKRPSGGKMAKLQEWWRNRLRKLGFRVWVCCTRLEVDEVLGKLRGL